jgi:hypothetical protein
MAQATYLLAILLSFVGMVVIDRRWRLGVFSRRLVATIAVVELVFLAFDLVGASRGWFASEPDRVVAIIPPGIPPEEPLLLAFLATFTIVLYRLAGRALRPSAGRPDAQPGRVPTSDDGIRRPELEGDGRSTETDDG